MGASLVEAQKTPQEWCEQKCAAICNNLIPNLSQSNLKTLLGDVDALSNLLFPGSISMNVFEFSGYLRQQPQAVYSTLVKSYPGVVVELCGTTIGQTNCSTVCSHARQNVGKQAVAPQSGAPAPKAVPAKK